MIRLLLVALISVCSFSAVQAQSWRKHVKLAEKLEENGKFLDAGEHYLSAWKQKQKKKELAYLAGKSFMRVKDYRRAAEAFKHVKDDTKKYPMIGLDYARALKQNGQYDDASREFVYFISSYSGDNHTGMNALVQNEIRGCELAIKASETKDNSPYDFSFISSQINSGEIEYAPIAFSDDILYYSSTVTGVSKIYRSQLKNGEWTKPDMSKDIAKNIEKKHFGNGTFTPDRKRFYFTQCDGEEGHFSHCEIYVIKNRNNRWSKPERLPDYINEENYTATHPFVVFDGDKEILYFSSDRAGGKGGMDLWYVERDKKSRSLDFKFPKNLGGRINTLGDEVSPFYQDGTLHFSSNGQVTYGGLDVFKTEGNRNVWRRVENIGQPFNSNADDWFFTLLPGQQDAGYLASNRLFGTEKITTTHEDLFSFSKPILDIVANGKIQEEDGKILRNAKVTLYEVLKNGQKRLLHTANFPKGAYEFALIPGKRYRVEAKKSGFETYSYEFDTSKSHKSNYGEAIVFESAIKPAGSRPAATALASADDNILPINRPSPKPKVKTESSKTNTSTKQNTTTYTPAKESTAYTPNRTTNTTTYTPAKETKTTRSSTVYVPAKKVYTTPTTSGSYTNTTRSNTSSIRSSYSKDVSTYGNFFAVQVDAPLDFIEGEYRALEDLGKIQVQYMPNQKIYRVLITEFYSKSDAKRAMRQAHKRGFSRAFMAQYNNGKRKYLGR